MEVVILEIKLVSPTHAVYTFGDYQPEKSVVTAMIRMVINPDLQVGHRVTLHVDS